MAFSHFKVKVPIRHWNRKVELVDGFSKEGCNQDIYWRSPIPKDSKNELNYLLSE